MEKLLAPLTDKQEAALNERQSDKRGDTGPEVDESGNDSSRTRAQRDRDRILYSAALARLAYVTQVTAPEAGHTFHNRLTHTFKVAQVARRNAERLQGMVSRGELSGAAARLVGALDPESVEASSLAHDLGHPPFGHIAEEVLQEEARDMMSDSFEGNAQSFRLVTRLSVRSNEPGLDLTRRTLNGLLKYPWRHWAKDPSKSKKRQYKWGYYTEDKEAFTFTRKGWPEETADTLPPRCLEAELMDWADDVTYAVHDMDDFFRAGLVPLDRLSVQSGIASPEAQRFAELLREAKSAKPEAFPPWEVEDLVEAATRVIGRSGPNEPYQHTLNARAKMRSFASKLITDYLEAFSLADNPASGKVKLTIDDKAHLEVDALKMLVVAYVVRRPSLAVVQQGQKRVIRDLFTWYYEASEPTGDRRIFPPSARERLEKAPDNAPDRARVVVDLISGLTETAAIQLHHRLAGGWTGSALDATAVIG